MEKMKPFVNSLTAVLSLLLLFYQGVGVLAQENGAAATIQVAQAMEIEIKERNWMSGTVIGRYDSKIAAEVEGRLEMVLDVGDRVMKGDSLAKIEALSLTLRVREMQAEILPKEARFDFLEREVSRLATLAEQNNAAKNRLDEVTSQMRQTHGEIEVARARLAQARDQLARTVVRAPFDGVVSERYKSEGERVASGDRILRLVNTGELEIQVRVPIETIANLQPGETMEVRDAEQTLPATLRTYVPVGDAVSRLYEMRLSFANKRWLAGHAVRVRVPVSIPRRVVAVPRDALVIRQNIISVYRIDEDMRAEYVAVKLGMSDGGLVEVIGDIKAGDRVVVRGNERLRPGQNISIITAE